MSWMSFRDSVIYLTLITVGVLIFSSGFLLRRTAFDDKSTISARIPASSYRRLLFVVIDALRYDFVASDELTKDPLSFYAGRFDFCSRKSQNSVAYRFIADPPTTTLQRLKGLLTGSLPTFIDMASNFGGSEISEDTLLWQLTSRNRSAVFLGDDTWMSLFPNSFLRSYPFPSFDVHDLHTVDDGVLAHVYEELRLSDWSLAVAHFLGVDHCGHRYGPDHPEMAKKLDQMNDVVLKFSDGIDEGTLLVVLGDHGMTRHGDHGGDSGDELNAALIVHSRRLRASGRKLQTLAQVDLLPTLSLLLGLPIPYSNLGIVIEDLFDSPIAKLNAVYANAEQMLRYAKRVSPSVSESGALNDAIQRLDVLLDNATVVLPRRSRELRNEMELIRLILKHQWAEFKMAWVISGLLIVGLTLFAAVVGLLFCSGNRSGRTKYSFKSILRAVSSFCIICHGFGLFSNSYVVYDDSVARFFFQTQLLLLVTCTLQSHSSVSKGGSGGILQSSIIIYAPIVLYGVLAAVSIRFSTWFTVCREEQHDCARSFFVVPFASLTDSGLKNTRFVLAVIPVCLLWYIPHLFLKSNGHFSDSRQLRFLVMEYGSKLLVVLLGFHLVTGLLPDKIVTENPFALRVFAPLIITGTALVLLIFLITNPILVSAMLENNPGSSVNNTVHKKSDQRLYLFGAASVFSAAFVQLCSILCPILALVLGDGRILALFGIILVYFMVLELLSAAKLNNDLMIISGLFTSLSSHAFYALGNQPTFASIPWHAAFVGISGSPTGVVLPALKVLVHLYAGQVVLGLLLPLVVIWPVYSEKLGLLTICDHTYLAQASTNESGDGNFKNVETRLFDDESVFDRLNSILLAVIAASAFKLFCLLCAAAVHRRHLMAWKIFAPKYMFGSVEFVVFSTSAVISYCFLWRVHRFGRKYLHDFVLNCNQ